jgi:hypothetical protein
MTSDTSPTAEPEHDEPMVPEAFAVRDAESANWVVRKIGESRMYAARVKAWAATELRRAERQEQFYLGRYGKQIENVQAAEDRPSGGMCERRQGRHRLGPRKC